MTISLDNKILIITADDGGEDNNSLVVKVLNTLNSVGLSPVIHNITQENNLKKGLIVIGVGSSIEEMKHFFEPISERVIIITCEHPRQKISEDEFFRNINELGLKQTIPAEKLVLTNTNDIIKIPSFKKHPPFPHPKNVRLNKHSSKPKGFNYGR